MSADNVALARRFFAESDRGRPPTDLCAAGFTAHFPGVPPMSLTSYDQYARLFRAPFSELTHALDECIGAGTAVAIRLRLQGVHTGDFMGIPPTGRSFAVPGAAFLHIVDEAIIELWGYLDQMGLMQQIGEPSHTLTPRR